MLRRLLLFIGAVACSIASFITAYVIAFAIAFYRSFQEIALAGNSTPAVVTSLSTQGTLAVAAAFLGVVVFWYFVLSALARRVSQSVRRRQENRSERPPLKNP